jgi:cation diffusion facilitator family transporter
MKLLTRWIVRKVIKDHRDVDNVKVRARYGSLEAWVSIIGNIILFVIKLIFGLMVNSVALIADAIHTLSDTGTSIIILVGFKIAKQPSDREHPFGHGRMESIATLIVSVLLIVTGFELLRSAGLRILNPQVNQDKISLVLVIVVCGTIVVKELMARFARELGIMIRSKTLEADFWHHRSDAFSSILVVIAMLSAQWGQRYIDGVAGVLVALIVMYSGYKIARDAISPLLGEQPQPELLNKIETIARGVDGVQSVHDVIVHRYGQVDLISLHIEVPENKPVAQLHDLSERVEDLLNKKIGGYAVVHIDPIDRQHHRYIEIQAAIEKTVSHEQHIISFHDLRVNGEGEELTVAFDITLEQKVPEQEITTIKQSLDQQLRELLGPVDLTIKAEPRFAYTR